MLFFSFFNKIRKRIGVKQFIETKESIFRKLYVVWETWAIISSVWKSTHNFGARYRSYEHILWCVGSLYITLSFIPSLTTFPLILPPFLPPFLSQPQHPPPSHAPFYTLLKTVIFIYIILISIADIPSSRPPSSLSRLVRHTFIISRIWRSFSTLFQDNIREDDLSILSVIKSAGDLMGRQLFFMTSLVPLHVNYSDIRSYL